MRKVIFVLLALSMAFISCKKETSSPSLNSSNWILLKSGVTVSGVICDEYKNSRTNQIVYEAQENNTKDYPYNRTKHDDGFGGITCPSSGTNCFAGTVDGEPVIILKKLTN